MYKAEDLRQGTVTLTPYPWNTSLPMSTKYYSKLTSSVFVQAECDFFMGIPLSLSLVMFRFILSRCSLFMVFESAVPARGGTSCNVAYFSLRAFRIQNSLGVSWVQLSWLTASAPVHVCSLYKFNSSWFPGCAVTLAGPFLWASSWNGMTVAVQFCM